MPLSMLPRLADDAQARDLFVILQLRVDPFYLRARQSLRGLRAGAVAGQWIQFRHDP